MFCGDNVGWRWIIQGVVVLATIAACSLNVVHTVVGCVGIVYGVAVGSCVVNGAMHVYHKLGVGCDSATLLEIPDAVECWNPVAVGIVELASIEERVGVGLGIVWLDYTEANVVERYSLGRVVVQYDALVYGKFAGAVVLLTTSVIQFFYNDRVALLQSGDAYK